MLEIVEGSLAAIEQEVETAIGRTARSPMIRDAHDFRAGIHDRRLRKLTGRSYSALVHPVARDFPLETMRPGDVFFHNDVYLSEGGIGHLPDLCVTVPVFVDDEAAARWWRSCRRSATTTTSGERCPARCRRSATSVFEEGLMVPPIKLWDQGVPQRGGAAHHDPQLADARLAGRRPRRRVLGLPDGRAPARRAVHALRPRDGRGLLRRASSTRRPRPTGARSCRRSPTARYVWEDYAEHDGVDEPRLHAQRITLDDGHARADAPLVLDFTGTSPQAKGPINHCGDYADGNFLKKWLAPILRNLADTPERMAELDVNEGVVPLIEMRFPPPGTLLTPVFPAPTNARTFVILRLLGVLAGVLAKAVDGRMPADQETIRYTGVYGDDRDGEPYLMREVLGGGSGGRYYADGEDTIHVVPDSRNLPTEFTESRFPFLVERLGLAVDSGGPGRFRGGLGYEKHIRMLRDAHFMSIADRSILACWGVKGGAAGRSFQVTIDPGGPAEREVDALADAEPVRAGEVIRIRTTGGGGWGDPLERAGRRRRARRARGARSASTGARADYGVVLSGRRRRHRRRRRRDRGAARGTPRPRVPGEEPFFDRGPGYARLSGGATSRRRRPALGQPPVCATPAPSGVQESADVARMIVLGRSPGTKVMMSRRSEGELAGAGHGGGVAGDDAVVGDREDPVAVGEHPLRPGVGGQVQLPREAQVAVGAHRDAERAGLLRVGDDGLVPAGEGEHRLPALRVVSEGAAVVQRRATSPGRAGAGRQRAAGRGPRRRTPTPACR